MVSGIVYIHLFNSLSAKYNSFLSVSVAGYSLLLGTKWVFEHQDLQMFGRKLNKYKFFSPT